MKIDLYTFVGMYSRGLDTLAHLLAQGEAFAQANGVSQSELLDWRLAPDMFNLRQQVQVVVDFARQWPARAAGVEVPEAVAPDLDLAGLRAEIAAAKAFLAGLRPEQFAGRDEAPHTQNLGVIEPTLPIGQWLSGFATTNFYFHLSTAYGILRHKGVQIGKRDLFAGGL